MPDLPGGMRMTTQRREVFEVVSTSCDHPCASTVYDRVKDRAPNISLATVYNVLDTLSNCGMIKQINVDRDATRYCPNLADHGHFYCEVCGDVTDIYRTEQASDIAKRWKLPKGASITSIDVALKGTCPKCSAKN